MARYILVGGHDSRTFDEGKALCEALANGLPRPHILSCFFAEPDVSLWHEKFERKGQGFFSKFLPGATVELADPNHFIEQVRRSDIVYLHGGEDEVLAQMLAQYPPLPKLCADKTVVGSSAGADYLAAVCWTCDERIIWRGQGFVRVAVMPHYQSDYGADDPRGPVDWEAAKAVLEAVAGDMPVYCLHEGEYRVIEQQP